MSPIACLNRTVLAILLFGGAAGAHAADRTGDFSFSYGAEYTSGEYDTGQTTSIFYFPFTFKFETDRFSASITTPLMMVRGPGNIVPGGDSRGIPINGGSGVRDTEAGVGDIALKGTVNVAMENSSGPRIDFTGKIKFGTADRDKNLGTGEDDIAFQVDLERNYNNAGLFGSIGYKFMGDPSGTNYKDVPYGSFGTVFRMSDTTSIGAAVEAQDNVLSGAPSQRELTFFLSSKADARTRVTGYFLKGLSDGSPDWGVGVAIRLYQ
jgi:hypothetical protein